MSQPPRRSRPKRPGQTIDLKAERSGTVGYAGPVSPSSAEAEAPEDQLAQAATTVSAETPADAPVETVPGTSTDEPAHAASGAGDTTLRDFAEDEGLVDPSRREKPVEEFEDETILAAAAPDAAAREAAAAKPNYDYHAATSLSQHDHRGGGFGSALGAGLLGALIALGGAGAAQYAGLLPSFGRQDPAELTQQFASKGDVQQVSADFATLREDVEQLKSAQAAGGAGAGATTADLNTVADRVTAIEQRANQAPATAAPAIDQGAVDGLRTAADETRRIAEEAKRAADEATGAVASIRQTAEGAVQTAGNAASVAGNAVQATETAQQTATTAQAAATAAQQAAATAQSTAGSATSAISALEPRISAMEASSRQAAVSIAAASLKSAIDGGSPFMGQLERFAQVAGPSPAVETLRGFAASGVPSKASLAAAWPEVEQAIGGALRPAPAEGDVGGQVLSGLSALVTVRPSGPAPASAEGSDAALSRLSAAISAGDLTGFLAEWDKLPEAGKTASADFQARVKARAEAEQVIGQTLDAAVQAVGTAG